MAKYFHLFNLDTEYQDERTNRYLEPWVSYTKDVTRVDYNKTDEEKREALKQEYLTLEIISSGTIYWMYSGNTSAAAAYKYPIYYKKNNASSWTSVTPLSAATTNNQISVSAGDKIKFYGTHGTYAWIGEGQGTYSQSVFSHYFSATTNVKFNVYGNIMSLKQQTEFSGITTPDGGGMSTEHTEAFPGLFRGCTGLIDASNLMLPENVNIYCYRNMFSGCTNLVAAPELPALSLSQSCYYQLFYGCSNLNHIKMMATNISASSCLYNWVYNVAATGTFVKNASATWTTTGASGVPNGWTIETASA